ncbi:hypothetical protein C4565_09915 [Candidatus Parcubacteria bacterium]|nr:MAG: hypothetical protein C4565_09915 [Candidatus Parcubacteria bacterium]
MNRIIEIVKLPSILKDLAVSLLVTIFIAASYIIVFYFFGGSKKIDTNITAFFGAILAFSGLMTKQYLFKETIDYLLRWIQIGKILDEIIENTNNSDTMLAGIRNDLIEQNKLSSKYSNYVKRELRIIPVIPILLVSCYGAALLASDSIIFRSLCLGLMLFMVSYLAKAALSSNKIAIEKPDIEQLISELTDLKKDILKDGTEQ